MSVIIPTTEPQQLFAGDSITWKRTLADYPASAGWYLKYRLLSAAGLIDIQSQADGDDHLVTISAAVSAEWAAGTYTVQTIVTNDTDRYTLATGIITVVADSLAATAATDTRTQARRILDALNLAIEGRAPRTDLEYEINTGGASRKIKSLSVTELLDAQQKYTLIVWREMNPGKLCPQVRLNVRCTNG
jgi:hypothetical protein